MTACTQLPESRRGLEGWDGGDGGDGGTAGRRDGGTAGTAGTGGNVWKVLVFGENGEEFGCLLQG